MTRLVLMLVASAAAHAPAHAQPVGDRQQMMLEMASVRLDNPVVVATVRQRIGRAAQLVCEPASRALKDRLDAVTCRQRAVRQANADLDRLISRRLPASAMLVR